MRFRRQLRIGGDISVSLDVAVTRGRANDAPPAAPDRAQIARWLGLGEDGSYARDRSRQRDRTIERLSGCWPANSTPDSLAGYVGEAALRFFPTVQWIEGSLGELALQRRRLLEKSLVNGC